MTSDLLIIQHYAGGTAGLVEEVAAERDRTVHFVRPFEGDPVPKDASDAWAVVVLGGPMAAWEGDKHPFLDREVEFLKACIDADTPTLAICLGGQLLARAAGARNYKGGMPEVGWYPFELTEAGKGDPLFAGHPPQPRFFFSHHDTFDLPPRATLLGSTRLYPNQAFRLGKRVYGVGFHPEKTKDMIEAFLADPSSGANKYRGVIDPGRIKRETDSLYDKRKAEAKRLITNFFERAEL
jgi:GMP synthase (glutamine-hydrolysing)